LQLPIETFGYVLAQYSSGLDVIQDVHGGRDDGRNALEAAELVRIL
jgi:hypothetical protein